MRNKRVTYFIAGFVLQMAILALIVYWFSSIAGNDTEKAIGDFASALPAFMQDATVVMITVAAVTVISMLFYSASRQYSVSRTFRNLLMGLILINAIITLWVVLSLM